MTPDENGWTRDSNTSEPDDNEQDALEPTEPDEDLSLLSPEAEPSLTEEAGPITPSWERRTEIGFAPALFKTIREVLLDPVTTFRHMPVTGGLGGPLLFVVLLGTVGSIFQGVYSLTGVGLQMIFPVLDQVTDAEAGMNVVLTVSLMILSPLLMVVGTFIGSGILHLFLMLFGGANRGFEATFRVISYVGGATALLNAIPICGGLILFVWSMVCETIGAKEAHQTTTWQALLAVITPWLLCCCLGVALVALLSAVGFGLATQAVQSVP